MTRMQGCKYLWNLPCPEKRIKAAQNALAYSLSFPVMQLLVGRGYDSPEALEAFLFTSRERDVADPRLLVDSERAVERIDRAISQGEKILIAGDYDVDGMTATSLMMAALLPLGARVNFFLPHRIHDGYGLSAQTIKRAAENGYRVVITVDNGITAFEAAAEALRLGIDLIITDHHRPHENIPLAYAVVNPCRSDCLYPFKKLAGVGVAFKLMSLLYEQRGKDMPEEVYELLLLGTIADVVPLISENRYWVRRGLQKVADRASMALQVLKRNARMVQPLSATDIGFFLTPQLNALGRLENPREAVAFLIGDDAEVTERIGAKLFALNQARKQVEKGVVSEVKNQIQQGILTLENQRSIMASHFGWPPGVIGLAAGRVASEYGLPTFLFHETAQGLLKGSCRSNAQVNIFEVLQESREHLLQFGGHAAAAGLSLKKEQFSLFKSRVEQVLHERWEEDDFKIKLTCDADLTLEEANSKLLRDLAHVEPFGCGNDRPVFYIKGATVIGKPQLIKEEHVRCMLFADGVVKPIIFFGRPELFDILLKAENEQIQCAVHVVENNWEGRRRVEFHGIDVAL
ncbi:MAG: Single-stranded-DNA-specific exonuclease RecJ [candidate division TM6 bacterium GW2011_GWE2_42_60]|nr:MAG: Single-stranded-DNA-specific exonuclease RecJ [candidate division TM6 bacterium GW2011_GWE2_42_60]